MLWSIVSNAFCKSIRTIPVRRPESKPFVILSCRYDKQVSVEWNFLKPDWYLYRTLLSDRKLIVLVMNNSLYNLRDKWKQRDGPEVLWDSFETFFIERLNLCDFIFFWERGEFDGKITNHTYRCAKYIWVVIKKPSR